MNVTSAAAAHSAIALQREQDEAQSLPSPGRVLCVHFVVSGHSRTVVNLCYEIAS